MSEIFSGNTITIENLGNSKAKLNKIGKSWQDTRSGKNKLPVTATSKTINGVTFTINSDKSITINGTNTGDSNISFELCNAGKLLLNANTNYKIVGKPNLSGVFLQATYHKNGTRVYATADTEFSTVEENTDVATGGYAYIRFDVGVTANNLRIYPMVLLATETDLTYEQYGQMPSPEFESPIENITGSAKITVCNENLFNYKDYTYDNTIFNAYRFVEIKGLKPNTTYTFSNYDLDKYSQKKSGAIYISRLPNYNKGVVGPGARGIYNRDQGVFNRTVEFTTSETGKCYLGLYTNTWTQTLWESLIECFSNATFLEGKGRTAYIPHQSQQFTFPLSEGQRMYKDSYLADDGVHHAWGEYIFTGEEDFNNTYGTNLFNIHAFSVFNERRPELGNGLCNYFKYNSIQYGINTSTFHGEFAIQYTVIGDYFNIFFKNTDFSSIDDFKEWVSENYANGTPLIIQYPLAEEVIEPYTAEQENVYMQLQNMELYEGINYIFIEDEPYAEISVTVTKLIEDYDSYISSNGRLIVPGSNINYLVDLSESDIPTMPEAVESSVRVAGRDGDVPLKTTYEPMSYSIVCYTEDNLSLLEKVEEEKKINKLLNSIKDKTMTFALEKSNKFYNVKYSGALTTINYPKHLKFSIPLKASDSYGKDLIKKSIVGNSIGESETAEKVGALFILRGPATNPIIALNDYSMEYGMAILEGARVEIDSNKSTITHINSSGIKTNVMKYYNHQFPKIENGINELKILSGFDSDMQVSVIWNDLKL